MQNLISVFTRESITNTTNALHMAVEAWGFDLTLINSLKETRRRNGINSRHECRTFAITLLLQAGKMLYRALTATSCLISLRCDDGQTVLSTIKPTSFQSKIESPQQQLEVSEIEDLMIFFMEEACNRNPG